MNPVRAWNRFLFGPISARPLGAFRIVFGLLLLSYLALMTVEFKLWYTGAGLLQGTEAREAAGPLRFSPLQYTDNPTIAYAVLAATAAVAVGLTLGWRTRVMSVLLYLGMLSLYHRNVSANGGPDAIPMLVCFYLMFCPSGAAYSLDALRAARKRGTVAEPLIVPWGVRLLQMQLCLIYFQSCVIKCQGAVWLNGTTIHYILFNREFGQFNMEWLAQYPLLINLMTYGAVLIEFALAFWLWFRPTRRWAILGGLLLHLGIRPVINVPGFGQFMTAIYITFLAPDELQYLIRLFDPRAAVARLASRFSQAALWPPGRQISLGGLGRREFPLEAAEARAAAEPLAFG
jgi:Vitamin K-dependent gamma-carboxylase